MRLTEQRRNKGRKDERKGSALKTNMRRNYSLDYLEKEADLTVSRLEKRVKLALCVTSRKKVSLSGTFFFAARGVSRAELPSHHGKI